MILLITFGGGPEEEWTTLLDIIEGSADSGKRVVLLLIHEACKSAIKKTFYEETRRCGADLYALREDLEAQGLLDQVVEGIEIIDYGGWVKLLEDCDSTLSWI